MDRIAVAKKSAIIAHRATKGNLSMVSIGYRTKCMRDAFMRSWNQYEERFPFVKRIAQ